LSSKITLFINELKLETRNAGPEINILALEKEGKFSQNMKGKEPVMRHL
jgi:hypothetical protein